MIPTLLWSTTCPFMGNLHPISLWNVICMIFSKVLNILQIVIFWA
ncbi:hypothetical protein MtrunA17_Chr1g0197341 [Medicago truncatula]|uniref:Transmembrane protein n=1 Tax=Medicago truncatula TaxID=3880 RepID=A0A396JVH3_MEDTR|nr:hypothetical protein MtrunA17_Chr1g0197341 [Medicago truncatula]